MGACRSPSYGLYCFALTTANTASWSWPRWRIFRWISTCRSDLLPLLKLVYFIYFKICELLALQLYFCTCSPGGFLGLPALSSVPSPIAHKRIRKHNDLSFHDDLFVLLCCLLWGLEWAFFRGWDLVFLSYARPPRNLIRQLGAEEPIRAFMTNFAEHADHADLLRLGTTTLQLINLLPAWKWSDMCESTQMLLRFGGLE